MGKVDDMRALREARFAQQQKAATPKKKADTARAALEAAESPKPRKKAPAKAVAAAPEGELCGHRAGVSGKACTRPLNHAERNHRYK